MTNRPLVLVVDKAADVLTVSPAARALVNELLRTGRRNGVVVRAEGRRPLRNRQYPTLNALENAAEQH